MRGEIPRLRDPAADTTGRKKKPGRFARDDRLWWSGSTDAMGRNDDFEWSGWTDVMARNDDLDCSARSNFMIAMIGLDAEG